MIKRMIKIVVVVLLVLILGVVGTLSALAAEEQAEELPESEAWNKVHAFGANLWDWGKGAASNVADTVKEKAPGWGESIKKGADKAMDKTQEIHQNGEQGFWGHFEDLTGQETGLSGRDAPDTPNISESAAEATAPAADISGVASSDEADAQSEDAQLKDASVAEESAEGQSAKESAEKTAKESVDQSEQDAQEAVDEASTAAHKEASQAARPEIETEPNRIQRLFDKQIVRIITIFLTIIVAVPCGFWISRKIEQRQK